jgi:cell division protein FtsW
MTSQQRPAVRSRQRATTSSQPLSVVARRPVLSVVGDPIVDDAPESRARSNGHSLHRHLGWRDANRLTVLVAALSCFGLVVVLSASSIVSITASGSPWSLFEKQVMWTVIGAGAFLLASRLDLGLLRRASVPMLVVSGGLLVAVFAPGISSDAVGGSSRWIGAGPLKIQPSELSKLSICLFAADLLARRADVEDQQRQIVYPLFTVIGVFGLLILKQPDMGTTVVLCVIGLSLLWAAGIERMLFVRLVSLLCVGGGIFAFAAPYRRARLFSFVNPFAHASTTGYQVVQSLEALGSGHITGTGLGTSAAKWGFLPNAWTDFIFAVIGNELGLVGTTAVLLAFAGFCWLGVRIAARTTDRFTSFLATGITCWIGSQAIINIGGVVGVLPETGIPLPFLSSGGSSLVVTLAAVGILVNISRSTARAARSPKEPSTDPRHETRGAARSSTAVRRVRAVQPAQATRGRGASRPTRTSSW